MRLLDASLALLLMPSLLLPSYGFITTEFLPTSRSPHHHQKPHNKQQPCLWESSSTPTEQPDVAPTAAASNDDDQVQVQARQKWAVQRVDRISDVPVSETTERHPSPLSLKRNIPPSWFVSDDDAVAARVTVDINETDLDDIRGKKAAPAFTLAGPRERIAFDPSTSRAAIVTCGGLCPGLNTVVRELVVCLRRQYGVPDVYGVPGGYRGFLDPDAWRELDEEAVSNLHNVGGTVLGSSRGGHDTCAIVDSLVDNGVNLLFVVGGDGTVRGAEKVADEVEKRGLPIAVGVVPKTIDNDVPLVDRTFGFETAVEAARDAVNVAHVEADGFPFGLGVVKVMGRNSGFIAMHTTLGTRVVDLCLVPEVDFYFDGPGGIVDHLEERLLQNGKAVIVVAEGAGQDLLAASGQAGSEVKDASGNVLLDDVGPWLCQQLKSRLDGRLVEQSKFGDPVSIKYVDPSYMVRGVAPNTADNVYCTQLAHNAVHGAMAGYTSFLVGSVNTRECYVPIRLVANKRNIIDTAHQSLWEYVVFDTGQPSFQSASDDNGGCEDGSEPLVSASGGVILGDECAL